MDAVLTSRYAVEPQFKIQYEYTAAYSPIMHAQSTSSSVMSVSESQLVALLAREK